MRKLLFVFLPFIVSPFLSNGQTVDKTAHEAFIITRMINKFHFAPREVNAAFSADVFAGMLDKTDEGKMFFTKSDITKLSVYTNTLDGQIKHQKTDYLVLFTSIYQRRLKQADSLITEVSKKPFDFFAEENFTVAERNSYPVSVADMRQKVYKRIKKEVLDAITDDLPDNFKSFTPIVQKRYVDSAETVLRKKATASLKRKIGHIIDTPGGVEKFIGNTYCEVIASCFDPHTEFFPPEEKETFENELGKQPFRFGFRIKDEKGGGVMIENLEPGSPAFKGGKLNKGDKFMAMQWEGSAPVDVSEMSADEFSGLLEGNDHKKAVFTVKKAGGAMAQVPLEKEKVSGDDDERVKSFILKGSNTIGYIYLPAFYEDWETSNEGLNGCANDVGREILKLKKENINGLVLDLRYNGGGSVQEATELSGIFIDAGPVEQEKGKDPKIYTLKDMNRGTIYDGPLAILVNGYSASATELVAGTLQDYNRAVIIGSTTYGKATEQVVFPMDTTVTPETLMKTETENYLKITVGKIYRVTGSTAQFTGVQPDIILPDLLDGYITREADAPFALRPNNIEANKYYQPYPPLPLKALAATVAPEIDTSKYFNAVRNFITYSKQQKAEKDYPLNLKKALAESGPYDNGVDTANTPGPSKKFAVQNNQYEIARMQGDSYLKDLNEDFIHQVASDPYIGIAYDVLDKLKTQ